MNVNPGGFLLVAGATIIDGTYNHNSDGGNLPLATWGAASICNVTGIINTALGTAEFAQTFGNFSWNCASQAVLQVTGVGLDMIVQGDFRVLNVNSLGANRLTFERNLVLGGDYENQAGVISLNMDGVVLTFNGNTDQTLSGGNGIRFGGLLIDKSPVSVVEVTSSNLIVLNSLALANGRIRLNNTDLTYAGTEINLTRANGWVETNGTGVGGFFLRPMGANLSFPVGDAAQYQAVRIADVPAGGAIVRFGVPTLPVPNAGLGTWTVRTFGGSSALTFLNPQGGGIDAASSIFINPNFAFTWTPVPTSFSASDYTTTVAATTGSIDEFSIFNDPVPTLSGFSPNSGIVGTLLTIFGTDFATSGAGNDVYFGAVKVASVLSADGITLNVNVPAGATSVTPITVVNLVTGLQVSSLSSSSPYFTVTNSPPLSITASSYSRADYFAQSTHTIATGDFNNDGFADIVTARQSGSAIDVFLNDGAGAFGTPISLTTPFSLINVKIADLDGDGNLDIVAGPTVASDLVLYQGLGDGSFAPFPSITGVSGQGAGIAFGDIDKDGNLDIIAANGIVGISVLQGDGQGNFANFPNSPYNSVQINNTSDVTVVDVNNDTYLDLVFTSQFNDRLFVLLNNQDGTFNFVPTNFINVSAGPFRVVAGLFDGDANLDLAILTVGGNIDILQGDGAGGFAPFAGSPVVLIANTLGLSDGDFDGDGITDLLVGSTTNQNITLLQGDGAGGFTAFPDFPFAMGNDVYGITTADFNNDGFVDLATANDINNTFSVLLNTTLFTNPTITSFSPLVGWLVHQSPLQAPILILLPQMMSFLEPSK
ncbi:MAG: hypothetical protein HC913_10845 [Microscillaceae bacterium]|nr:hypothetical protein [Microscillaceae bacterium]